MPTGRGGIGDRRSVEHGGSPIRGGPGFLKGARRTSTSAPHSIYSVRCETSRRMYVVRGETDKTASDFQARSFMARTLDEIEKKC